MKPLPEIDNNFLCDIKAPCFQILTPEEVEVVKASKTQVLFRKGDNLTKQGAFSSYILFLSSGLVKQYVEDDFSKNFNLRIIKPGEFIGLSSVFTGNKLNYTTLALNDCRAFLIEKETISNVIKQNGSFGFNLTKRYCEQNSRLFETLRTCMFKQMNGRMAETLLHIGSLKKEYPDVFQLLSRKDIADFTGITPESAIKLLKLFERDGLIKLGDKDIVVLKEKELEEISKKG